MTSPPPSYFHQRILCTDMTVDAFCWGDMQYQPLFADAPFDNQDMDAYMDYKVRHLSFFFSFQSQIVSVGVIRGYPCSNVLARGAYYALRTVFRRTLR